MAALPAGAGKAVYEDACASCHGADFQGAGGIPSLKGAAFLTNWRGRPAALLGKVRTMPPGAANSLPDADYRAVTEYLLEANGLAPEG